MGEFRPMGADRGLWDAQWLMQLLFWSKIVYPARSPPNARRVVLSGIEFIFQRAGTLFDEFFDRTGCPVLLKSWASGRSSINRPIGAGLKI